MWIAQTALEALALQAYESARTQQDQVTSGFNIGGGGAAAAGHDAAEADVEGEAPPDDRRAQRPTMAGLGDDYEDDGVYDSEGDEVEDEEEMEGEGQPWDL